MPVITSIVHLSLLVLHLRLNFLYLRINYLTLNSFTMKKITLIISMITVCFVISTSTFAQASATATASATIVTPISIVNAGDMNFGNVAVSATAGTVILAPAGTRTLTGGVTLPGTAGTVTAAQFTVNGQADYTYAITLPTGDLTLTNATAQTMIVNTFSSSTLNNSGTAAGVLTLGTDTVSVGATLNVGATQVAGLYENATGFDVTVNYN